MTSLLEQLLKIVTDGKRKKRAAVTWCDKINTLVPEQRSNAEWQLCPLGRALSMSGVTRAHPCATCWTMPSCDPLMNGCRRLLRFRED